MARITQLHPEDDSIIQIMTIQTASSELVRPLIKVLLPEKTPILSSSLIYKNSC